jgi:hypothetical protein
LELVKYENLLLISRYLAFSGQTSIEYLSRKSDKDEKSPDQESQDDEMDEEDPVDFRTFDWRKNLEYVFGTSSYWEMLLPSVRKLKHDGVEWRDYINKTK